MAAMSPRRSRRGGTWTTKHSSRWNRSRRNSPGRHPLLEAARASRRRRGRRPARPPPGAADAPHLVAVERPQELRLRVERQVADLVEEERAALGVGERALAPRVRAGERAPLVAEQLALDELPRQRRHVEATKGRARRGPSCVKRARDELLAGPALAGDEHGQRVPSQPAHLVGEPAHGDRRPGDPGERLARAAPSASPSRPPRRRASSARW